MLKDNNTCGQAQSMATNLLKDNRIKWMTVKDTAIYLRRTENAIRILLHRGYLNSYKLGGRIYLKRSEIDEKITTSNLIGG